MLLERTIFQLDVGHVPPEQAEDLGQLGYMQWLGALRPDRPYTAEAQRAHAAALPFAAASPAVAVFCALLEMSLETPGRPLPLKAPTPIRRGGASARRLSI